MTKKWEFTCSHYELCGRCDYYLTEDRISGDYAIEFYAYGDYCNYNCRHAYATLKFIGATAKQMRVITWIRLHQGSGGHCYVGHTSYGDIYINHKNPTNSWGDWWIMVATFWYDSDYDLRLGKLEEQDPETGERTEISFVNFGHGEPAEGYLYFKCHGYCYDITKMRLDNTDILAPI